MSHRLVKIWYKELAQCLPGQVHKEQSGQSGERCSHEGQVGSMAPLLWQQQPSSHGVLPWGEHGSSIAQSSFKRSQKSRLLCEISLKKKSHLKNVAITIFKTLRGSNKHICGPDAAQICSFIALAWMKTKRTLLGETSQWGKTTLKELFSVHSH